MDNRERSQQVDRLIGMLLEEMPSYGDEAASLPASPRARRRFLRGLMNVRPSRPLSAAFLAEQDELLRAERDERGVVDPMTLPTCALDGRIALWQGDICRLSAGAIVNAANSELLGCFVPCHGCIDNAIHSAAGLELREECARIIAEQGTPEPAGGAKVTLGYNLPAAHVIHTVGPICRGGVPTEGERATLASCYESCLDAAAGLRLGSIAFCCISTGVFGYPRRAAAEVAVAAVRAWLDRAGSGMRVVFDVFDEEDHDIYERLLG